jgi:Spy/CpxP family protein refolding chaperone
MSLRRKLTVTSLTLGLIFALSAVAFAQQQPATQDNGQQQQGEGRSRGGRRRAGMGKRGHGGILRLAGQLNLTDAQRQQLGAIAERFESSIRPRREEMRRLHESSQGSMSADAEARAQALRAEMGQAMKGMRQEMLSVLTEEQRAQLEQLRQEREARHQERRGGGGRRMNQQNDDNDQ